MTALRNSLTFAACFWLSASLACDTPPPCGAAWSPQPQHEDLVTCNQTRIGARSAYSARCIFDSCMRSFGYSWVCVSPVTGGAP